MELLKDLYAYILDRRKFWLVPLIIILLLAGLLIIAGGTELGAFIYTLF